MTVQGILLDIEGTTSSISFVHEEMFPFARHHLPEYLARHWGSKELNQTLEQLAKDLQYPGQVDWLGHLPESDQPQEVIVQVNRLMDQDVKATGLKQLQGQIWKQGFEAGQLVAHFWEEVPQVLRDWKAQGIDLRIYSSGSIAAQKMFFGHSLAGNLLPLISGHYDTTIGNKRDTASYRAIAQDWKRSPQNLLFLSDIPAELDAARQAGYQVCLSLRPGNAPVPDNHDFPETCDFRQLPFSLS